VLTLTGGCSDAITGVHCAYTTGYSAYIAGGYRRMPDVLLALITFYMPRSGGHAFTAGKEGLPGPGKNNALCGRMTHIVEEEDVTIGLT